MKYTKEDLTEAGVNIEMFNLESWLKMKTKKNDLRCSECKREYETLGEGVSVMIFKTLPNAHLCNDCARKYIELGAKDVRKLIEERKALIEKILSIKQLRYIDNKPTEELLEILSQVEKERDEWLEKERIIKESIPSKEDWKIEQYLTDQYNVYQDKKYLTSELQIEEYFKKYSGYFFDCGQGYYQEETSIIVNIGKKFYEVTITAEIGSSKQNRGDRLYWVEGIEKVTYVEIDKPKEKMELYYNYSVKLSKEEKSLFEVYLSEKEIEFEGGKLL